MDQIILVQTTFADVLAQADHFSTVFYDHLFATEPRLRPMSASDAVGQRRKLIDEFTFIVANLGQLANLMERATELGRQHLAFGVQPRHYDLVLDSTLFALRSILGEQLTAEAETAWRRGFNLAVELMLHATSAPTPPVTDYD